MVADDRLPVTGRSHGRICPVQADCRMNQALGLRETGTKKLANFCVP
ncbi:hypothetical protein AVDCRST_MAG84-5793 [uncultured Microcoleus sp.]|uniref:Uncharacterized protein n=1 Tax=uncultured Microcoleus sp. TaxID=259945 RepID=A0A6J4NT89_9CYAN|nr:hypothetical protein AVDCRST_MAG84-5793 [uncultured Microcoleus sp.]